MLQAPPGTPLFDRLQRESRMINTFSGDNVDGTTNIVLRMGIERLLNGYRSMMKQIHSPKNYYRCWVRTLLKELKAPKINQPINIQRFLSMFRSAFRLGVLGTKRFQYWQLMIWPLICKPRLISVAITLSIYGSHYRRICERYIYQKHCPMGAKT